MLNNYGKPNIMTYDILQVSATVISGIISVHQILRIGDHTHSSITKLFPAPISSMFYYVLILSHAQIKNALHTVTETKAELCMKVNSIEFRSKGSRKTCNF